jgi:ribose transport system permease protein
VGIGATVVLVNALLITRAGINAVITTLGTAAIVGGVITHKTGGLAIVADIPRAVTDFGSGTTLGIPSTTFALVLVAGLVYYVLEHTPFGRYVYALGESPGAARLVGLRTDLLLAATFVASGSLAGAAGVLQVARAGGADPRVGESFTLPALAAAFLSAAAIKPGRYNVAGVLTALFFLAVLNSGLNLAGAQPYVSQYVNGTALIVGVGLAIFLGRKRRASA